ncbi:DNA-3-methyladenine glycosylase 2 family protein [uncultured Tateyamaria sp.]|uniref:DNA-3-methyladenine glycosylase family protein n=1 Tax=uncultured Tateyamaria sp. TaxID=455651 RepID=UPI00262723B6|nr:DNA-3-methyladenine glycosylase 2 family protein [uncultured Tateyamaria sp.]
MGAITVTGRIIETQADVDEGAAWLAAQDPALARAVDIAGPLPLRRRPDGFAALLNAIIGQQVSTASANAIWQRLDAGGLTAPAAVLAAREEGLRSAGLSRQKISYALALAEAGIDYDQLRSVSDADVIAQLTAVKGIGVWTAEIYAMFALGRADVFAPGDLALQEAARMIFDLPERPKERALREMAEEWRPWRAVAARLFFTYYRVAKGREGIT